MGQVLQFRRPVAEVAPVEIREPTPHEVSSVIIAAIVTSMNVLADIRKMLADLGHRPAEFSADLPDSYGRPQAGFQLPKRETLILVSGYSVALRAKIIDRWEELERQARQPAAIDYSDPALILGFIGHLRGEVAKKDEVISALTPKAEALDRIATADGSLCISDAAKTLQKPPRETFKFMRTHGWIFRRLGSAHDVGYSDKLKAGLLEHKTTTVERSDGSEKVVTQVRVTPKGLVKLAEALGMGPMQ